MGGVLKRTNSRLLLLQNDIKVVLAGDLDVRDADRVDSVVRLPGPVRLPVVGRTKRTVLRLGPNELSKLRVLKKTVQLAGVWIRNLISR